MSNVIYGRFKNPPDHIRAGLNAVEASRLSLMHAMDGAAVSLTDAAFFLRELVEAPGYPHQKVMRTNMKHLIKLSQWLDNELRRSEKGGSNDVA